MRDAGRVLRHARSIVVAIHDPVCLNACLRACLRPITLVFRPVSYVTLRPIISLAEITNVSDRTTRFPVA
jgi:hypothetical protein